MTRKEFDQLIADARELANHKPALWGVPYAFAQAYRDLQRTLNELADVAVRLAVISYDWQIEDIDETNETSSDSHNRKS